MALSELWLVRHGESAANVAATAAEREQLDVIPIDIRDADVPLSAVGEEQAAALQSWMEGRCAGIQAFWVSPYARARQTLALALGEERDHAAVTVDERLRDRELGILDLLTPRGVSRFHPEEAARRRHLGKFYHRPPGGESWADVALRLRSFLRDAGESGPDTAMIVAHDAVIMLLLYLLRPMEEPDLLDFAASHTVRNASITHLARGASGWDLLEFSSVDHLRREGAEVTVHSGGPDVRPQ